MSDRELEIALMNNWNFDDSREIEIIVAPIIAQRERIARLEGMKWAHNATCGCIHGRCQIQDAIDAAAREGKEPK